MDPYEEEVEEEKTAEEIITEDMSMTLASADEYYEYISYTYSPEEGLRAVHINDEGITLGRYQVNISVEEL